MAEKLRIGVVGCGIGRLHLEGYKEQAGQFEVTAICDIDLPRAEALAEEYGVVRVESDFTALCRMDEVDVVDICTPSYLHARQGLEALEAGKHVIVEKPLAGSLKDVDALIDAEKRTGKLLMPIFQNRFGHGAQKLRLLRQKGLTGKTLMTTVETHWRRRPPYYAVPWRGKWATELGGALVTLAIHAHDLLYYILGPATTVSAFTGTLVNPIQTEDSISAALQMADGSLAALSVTTGSAVEITRHRFCFSQMVAESNPTPYANTLEPWSFTADLPEYQGEIDAALEGFAPLPEGFPGQFDRFYTALQTGAELPVTLADARNAIELITAIYYSAAAGERVTLPIQAGHAYYAGWQKAG